MKNDKFMSQILVTEKVFVTPEFKAKRKMYKLEFFISAFLLCLVFSFYIYAEYDKTRSEEVSKEILEDLSRIDTSQVFNTKEQEDNTTVKLEDDVLVIALDTDSRDEIVIDELIEEKEEKNPGQVSNVYKTSKGKNYYSIGSIYIPKINVDYPILDLENPADFKENIDELLKISPTKYWGPDLNKVGNFCIVGHNYRNRRFFSKVPTLENGDIIEITDLNKKKVNYVVYKKYIVDPKDTTCTSQLTNGKTEITLITCTDDSKNRYVIKAVRQ